jgi:hypothetical protein
MQSSLWLERQTGFNNLFPFSKVTGFSGFYRSAESFSPVPLVPKPACIGYVLLVDRRSHVAYHFFLGRPLPCVLPTKFC